MGSASLTDVVELSIAQDFSPFPGGRRREDGPFSGTKFRDDVLKPLLDDHESVVMVLDGVAGLPSSFWEEVFGGLVRNHIIDVTDLGKRLRLRTTDPELEVYIPLAYKYAKDVAEAGDA